MFVCVNGSELGGSAVAILLNMHFPFFLWMVGGSMIYQNNY